MPKTGRRDSRDSNEDEMIFAYNMLGAEVRRIPGAFGGDMAGVPDLLVGYNGINFLTEVKN